MFSKYLQEYAQQKYDSRIQWMGPFLEEIRQKLSECAPKEQMLMKFLYGTMPLRDLAEYPFETFLDFVRHGIRLRERMEWCRELPEEIFLNDVLYYRINSENIEQCRSFFYEKLKDRIQGKSLEEAVLEINYWCAERCAYEASDLRTLSPMGMYRAGAGRCGEESVFAVTALRSVGIAARQVYAPWWAHCDDNHAWAEVYVRGDWHFLGACEPEEALDQGWFVNASSRALLVHARTFSDFGKDFAGFVSSGMEQKGKMVLQAPSGNAACKAEWYQEGELPCYQNVTARYARTRKLLITVTESGGSPASHARVSAEVLNGAEYRSLAVLEADENGTAALELGLGTVRLHAGKEGRIGEKLLDVGACSKAHITLGLCPWNDSSPEIIENRQLFGDAAGESVPWSEMDFRAPEETILQSGVPNKQREKNRERIRQAALLRSERTAGFYQEGLAEKYQREQEILRYAAGNFFQLYQFLERDKSPDRKWLLHSLSLKDYRDARADVLEEHLKYASACRSMWVGEKKSQNEGTGSPGEYVHCAEKLCHEFTDPPEEYVHCAEEPCHEFTKQEIYIKYLLCPRIFYEELTCYRQGILDYFSEEEKSLFRRNPAAVWDYVKTHIKYEEPLEYRTIYSTPLSVLKLQSGTPMSQKILCAAICRTLGIPARISQAEQEVEIYRNGSFVKLSQTERPGRAILTLKRKKEEEWNYSQNWTIARFLDGQFVTLDLQGTEFEGEALNLETEPGYYRILTANRLPNGNQLAAECKVLLTAGGKQEVSLKMRTGSPEELLVSHRFKEFEVLSHGRPVPVSSVIKDRTTILAFLEPGEEPTEHVLNELLGYQEKFRQMGVRICFLVREGNVTLTTAWKQAAAIPEVCIYQAPLEDIAEPLARSMYTDPEKLPLLVIANPGLQGIYACSGYRVGSVKLMLELLKVNFAQTAGILRTV
ncbi:MAG: transglutaminase domain-containing protein [Lachnospiraceae bacterium]|nr:transglutaminase domain-containing protein [Lachnospiraceae bacterium]